MQTKAKLRSSGKSRSSAMARPCDCCRRSASNATSRGSDVEPFSGGRTAVPTLRKTLRRDEAPRGRPRRVDRETRAGDRARDLRFGERADSNAFARCTALDVVKERTVHEIESRARRPETVKC